MDYEHDNFPSIDQIKELVEPSFLRMDKKRQEIGFFSDTIVYIKIDNKNFIQISLNGSGYEIVNSIAKDCNYVIYNVDLRLLFKILKGPKYAHWNNAEIGSHIQYKRSPNIFERGLYHSMCFFHS